MILTCPNCHEQITAENVNIQQMAAVCSNCDTVFSFELPAQKIKRRKVKRPPHLTVHDDNKDLSMTFRTNFRLDKNEAFLLVAIFSVIASGMAVLFFGQNISNGDPIIFPILFIFVPLMCYYWLALIVYNKTVMEMVDETITISRQPLPNIFNQGHAVNLSSAVRILCEETPVSKKEGYDTPRYRVLVAMADGSQRVIVSDVIADYGFYIAQQLEEHVFNRRNPESSDRSMDLNDEPMPSDDDDRSVWAMADESHGQGQNHI